eukprot:11219253-Lingulodinium_polyedra.AAC.1
MRCSTKRGRPPEPRESTEPVSARVASRTRRALDISCEIPSGIRTPGAQSGGHRAWMPRSGGDRSPESAR